MNRRKFLAGSASALGVMGMSGDGIAELNAMEGSSAPAPGRKIRVRIDPDEREDLRQGVQPCAG